MSIEYFVWFELNSAGGEIRLWVEVRKGLTGEVCKDLGLFSIVAYNEPSTGPCVCCDDARIIIQTTTIISKTRKVDGYA